MERYESFFRPYGTCFLFRWLTPGLTSGAIVCRPSGAEDGTSRKYPRGSSVPAGTPLASPPLTRRWKRRAIVIRPCGTWGLFRGLMPDLPFGSAQGRSASVVRQFQAGSGEQVQAARRHLLRGKRPVSGRSLSPPEKRLRSG